MLDVLSAVFNFIKQLINILERPIKWKLVIFFLNAVNILLNNRFMFNNHDINI